MSFESRLIVPKVLSARRFFGEVFKNDSNADFALAMSPKLR